jgi:outer membrane protein assembly factor BamB
MALLVAVATGCARAGGQRDGGDGPAGADASPAAEVAGRGGPDGGSAGMPTWNPARHPWPMFAHDARRTARSPFNGPTTYTPGSARNWKYVASAQASINMQPVVTDAGVFFGGWGLKRQVPGSPAYGWTKSDGSWFGLRLDARDGPAQQLWAPFDPQPTPGCYLYAFRMRTSPDQKSCGAGNDYHLSWYNGTIEGTAVVDPDTGVLYVGRGDRGLYAVDPVRGVKLWRFASDNPEDVRDPEGGGEIVGGPLMGPGRLIYLATWGLPWPARLPDEPAYETHAVYAVDTAGRLVWRYPSIRARLDDGVLAAPALSPDGRTLYVGTWYSNAASAGRLLALDLTVPANAPDVQRLRWSLDMKNPVRTSRPFAWVRHLSVGADGTVFVGGFEVGGVGTPIAAAVKDRGASGEIAWWVEPQGYPSTTGQMVQGLALWEEGGVPVRLVASTGHVRDLNGQGGALFWLDARTGATLATFDPAKLPTPGVGGMSPPILGDDGTAYVGLRGRHDLLATPDVTTSQWRNGHVYAVRLDAASGTTKMLFDVEVDGLIDWAAPAIGANGALYFGSTAKFRDLVELQPMYPPGMVPQWTSPVFSAVFE